MSDKSMNVYVEAAKLWLRTYEKVLFTKVNLPGTGKGTMILNQEYAAKRADDVVKEFKIRFIRKYREDFTGKHLK